MKRQMWEDVAFLQRGSRGRADESASAFNSKRGHIMTEVTAIVRDAAVDANEEKHFGGSFYRSRGHAGRRRSIQGLWQTH